MLWLNDNREQIKRENPGIKVTEVAKRGGELWRALKDKSVSFNLYLPVVLQALRQQDVWILCSRGVIYANQRKFRLYSCLEYRNGSVLLLKPKTDTPKVSRNTKPMAAAKNPAKSAARNKPERLHPKRVRNKPTQTMMMKTRAIRLISLRFSHTASIIYNPDIIKQY